MKKKILLVLLVVLMVGILAFSVFACNGDKKKDPVKNNNQTEDPDDEVEDTDYLTPMLQDVVGAIDNTIKGITDIDKAASVSASIFVDVEVDGETYNVALDIAGSIDKENKNKNWAQIDANVLGVEVSLFAVNNGEVEDLYIAQNILNEEKQWNKLSQFEEANALSNLACNGIIDAVADLLDNEDEKTGATLEQQINGGILNSLAGGMLGAVGAIGGSLFVPGEGADVDFSTADGYAAGINVEGISGLLKGLGSMLAGLPAEYHGIIETAVGILLGGELDLSAGTFEPGAADKTPTIELAFGVKDDLFTGLEISYALPDLSVEFGINNLSLKGTSASYDVPFKGEPEELAIALSLDLVAPGISAEAMNAQVNIYPNVAMSFDEDGYVALDLSKLYAVADLTIGDDVYTIAEYNVDGNEDIILDLEPIANLVGAGWNIAPEEYLYRIPVDLQSKFDKMIADEKASKAPVASNAIKVNGKDKNVVDFVLEDIVPGLFNEDGSFNIGGVVGVLGQVGAIVEEIKPILETEGLFSVDAENAKATLNLEVLMDALLNDSDIITGITGEWNSFNLYKYNADEEIELVEGLTLADLLAEEDVLENVVAFVNTLIYENYVNNFVPATEGEEALSYAAYYENNYELTEDAVITAIADIAGATVVADEFYTGLEATVSGYAQKGIGAALEIAIADGKIGFGIGAEIITNVAVEDYEAQLSWAGDKNGKKLDMWGNVTDEVYSNVTGNDGGKMLLNAIKKIANEITGMIYGYVGDASSVAFEGSKELPYALADGTTSFEVSCNDPQTFICYSLVIGNGVPATVTWTGNINVGYFAGPYAYFPNQINNGGKIIGTGAAVTIAVSGMGAGEITISYGTPATGAENDPIIKTMGLNTCESGLYYIVTEGLYADYEATIYCSDTTATVVVNGTTIEFDEDGYGSYMISEDDVTSGLKYVVTTSDASAVDVSIY